VPLAGGSVYFYVPGTSTPSNTWQNTAQTILNSNPVLLDSNGQAIIYGVGEYRQVVFDAVGNLLYDQVTYASASSSDLLAFQTSLAAGNGASLIGFEQPQAGAVVRTVLAKERDWLNATDFAGVDPTGATDSTVGLTAFLAAAIAGGHGANMSGTFKVSTLLIPAGNLHIHADCTITGLAVGTFNAVVEILNAVDLTIEGRMLVSGAYNTGYSAGIKIWTNTTGSSLINISGVSVAAAQTAWQFGDFSEPDALVSEIMISAGYAFGCPNVIKAIGTETVVNFVDYIIESGYGGGTGAWLALSLNAVIVYGGVVAITAGEMLQTNATTGSLIILEPIASASSTNPYGSIRASNVVIECASPFFETGNGLSVSSPVSGDATFVGCRGLHTQNLQPLFITDAQYTGRLAFSANDFTCTTTRTQPNIQCLGACNVYCDDMSFSTGFLSALAGISGGIVHFTYRMILAAANLAGQFFPASTETTMKFQSLNNTGDLAKFAADYSLSTGIFTAPIGGLKNIRVEAQLSSMLNTDTGIMHVTVNGTQLGIGTLAVGIGKVSYSIPQLNAGDQVITSFFNTAGSQNAGSSSADWMQIFASN